LIKKYYSKNKNYFSKVYNIGNPRVLKLEKFISILESVMNYKFIKVKVEKQLGDVFKTQANLIKEKKFNFTFRVTAKEGLKKFFNWYKIYNKI
jgi:nucleoside-diphosphate-sugar epimerase